MTMIVLFWILVGLTALGCLSLLVLGIAGALGKRLDTDYIVGLLFLTVIGFCIVVVVVENCHILR